MNKLIFTILFMALTFISQPSNAVIGGHEPKEYSTLPVVAILFDEVGSSKPTVCSGTLLNPSTILTAAHCFVFEDAVTKIIVVRSLDAISGDRNVQEITLDQVVLHPDFIRPSKGNDFAVIKLKESFPDASLVRYPALSLSLKDFLYYAIVGYGKDDKGNRTNLNYTVKNSVETVSIDPSEPHFLVIDQTNNEGVSKGDSGGPILSSIGSKLYLIAVISMAGRYQSWVTRFDTKSIAWIQSLM